MKIFGVSSKRGWRPEKKGGRDKLPRLVTPNVSEGPSLTPPEVLKPQAG
jgi:hypothetical protein